MIPFIRSLSELMAITESRDSQEKTKHNNDMHNIRVNSGQRSRDIRSSNKKEVYLPNFPKILRRQWIRNKESVLKLIDNIDYTDSNIKSIYDMSVIERENVKNQQDVA